MKASESCIIIMFTMGECMLLKSFIYAASVLKMDQIVHIRTKRDAQDPHRTQTEVLGHWLNFQ